MSEPDFLSTSQIAVVGLGLMGGSLAMALADRCQHLLGCDRDAEVLELAHRQNLFVKLSEDPGEILPEADIVILATPLRIILELIEQMPELHPGAPIVMDLGSTKSAVAQAFEEMPSRFDPLGGHPMCGKEKTGFGNAERSLFQGAAFVFTPLERTSMAGRSFGKQVASAIGAHALWLDPETHDQWAAATSHLPYLATSALAGSTPNQSKPLVGPGFRSTTRIAATPPEIMLDVLETNRDNILEQMERFRQLLDHYQELLSSGEYAALKLALDRNADKQRDFIAGQEEG